MRGHARNRSHAVAAMAIRHRKPNRALSLEDIAPSPIVRSRCFVARGLFRDADLIRAHLRSLPPRIGRPVPAIRVVPGAPGPLGGCEVALQDLDDLVVKNRPPEIHDVPLRGDDHIVDVAVPTRGAKFWMSTEALTNPAFDLTSYRGVSDLLRDCDPESTRLA
jgi:hypothetical protein